MSEEKRCKVEKVWRGHWRIVVDGVVFGDVKQEPGRGWIAHPVVQVHHHSHTALYEPDYRGSRQDSAEWLLDYSGIPLSVARALLFGWTLDDDQTPWVDAAVKYVEAFS